MAAHFKGVKIAFLLVARVSKLLSFWLHVLFHCVYVNIFLRALQVKQDIECSSGVRWCDEMTWMLQEITSCGTSEKLSSVWRMAVMAHGSSTETKASSSFSLIGDSGDILLQTTPKWSQSLRANEQSRKAGKGATTKDTVNFKAELSCNFANAADASLHVKTGVSFTARRKEPINFWKVTGGGLLTETRLMALVMDKTCARLVALSV